MTGLGLLLAAGRSRRFGAQDKLRAPFLGKPLVAHAALALRGSGVDACLAVAGNEAVARCLAGLGMEVIRTDCETDALSATLRAGIAAATARQAVGVLVALGDMPLVSAELMAAVRARGLQAGLAALTDGRRRTPPAWFGASRFGDLAALRGDAGAGALLRAAPVESLVAAAPATLADVDTPDDLARLAGAARGCSQPAPDSA